MIDTIHTPEQLEGRLAFTTGLLAQHESTLSEQGVMLVKRAIFSNYLALRRRADNAA